VPPPIRVGGIIMMRMVVVLTTIIIIIIIIIIIRLAPLRVLRQRQVWLIPIADKGVGVQVKL